MSLMTEPGPGRSIALWGTLTAVLAAAAILGAFLVAPEDADQGVIQRIFYFHVSIAITSLIAFGVAFVAGLLYLRKREGRFDEIGAVSIALGLVMSALTVLTGSIWAKASWGIWWQWADPRLVTYAIVVLLYVAYFMLRSSVEGERQARYSAIYSVVAFASVPLSFYSVRVAQSFVHPVVFTQSGANMPDTMLVWFIVSQLAMISLFVTLLKLELLQRRTDRAIQRLKLRLEAARPV
jgi:heme exporter protein C